MQAARVKRQKVSVACQPCRLRKTKCDGRGPVCQPCQKKAGTGLKCTWKLSTAPPPAPSSTNTERIQAAGAQAPLPPPATSLEGSQPPAALAPRESPSGRIQPTVYQPTFTHPPQSPLVPGSQPRDAGERTFAGLREGQGSALVPQHVSPSEQSVHAIIGAALEEDNGAGFFGSSSAGTFMQSVKKMIQQKVSGATQPEDQPLNENPQLRHLPASGNPQITQKHFDYVLPSRRRADHLMSVYWEFVHVLYPYLDKLQVQEDYEKLWKGDAGPNEDERSFLCLLNTMFALSSQLDESTPIEEREQLAQAYYTRARGLLDIVEGGSVRSVQAFLLLAQYFQSTNQPHPCWMFVGLGIRTAQSLGLHLPETSERAADVRTRELLRKVWHGCILMDRVICMTYGRPCMVGPKAAVTVPLPLAIEEEDLMRSTSREQVVELQRSSAVEFYVHSLQLYTILHDVLFNFYSVNFQQTRPLDADKYFGSLSEGQSSVFEIEHRLFKWENSIPDHLKMASRPQVDSIRSQLYRQAVILHQRQLHVRLLLLRPVLSSFITTEFYNGDRSIAFASVLSRRIFLQCAIVCVRVALEAIHVIHQKRGRDAGDIGNLAAWWYNVLYLYTSATVLIAARLSPTILVDVSEESILDGWRKAMELLDWYGPFGPSIKRLTTILRLLSDAVPQQYSRFKGNSQQPPTNVVSVTQNLAQRSPSMPPWRPSEPVDNAPVAVDDTAGAAAQDDVYLFSNDPFLDFDSVFDPNDLSWLMTIPLDS
ncbi:uncharacterized protein Z520_09425 [Fonsecaea multimorphosa CBS 102226]|uniref:Zn(2)-C6 fungal-type domain-containing protein n=1 Tax=Fonsecaea multimorphosa CBS 102226 TaxID=1442371 RepID=A0A0D2GYW2_9EURO|nr:uncharacterized protein Z520_09425 [Fonsecaea multimorphosa CBS 102226]KIX94735.1 hypothetical protein Z520_09425 [Fonsecaea multimorphosa CBS 102226]OAL20509.1 hypothetical protein AYO22_08810 [Fonsecaea multimorphosa]